MQHHPLTPMTQSDLVRVLQAQAQGRVGLLRHDVVAQGVAAVQARVAALRAEGVRLAVADAIDNDALRTLAAACADLPLITAGSGVALGLPAVYQARGWLQPDAAAAELAAVGGGAAVVSGSCSLATNAQVQHWCEAGHAALAIDPLALAAGQPLADQALAWALQQGSKPVLVYATRTAEQVRAVQAALGSERAGQLVEACLARVAAGLVRQGVRRLVVAGGETSGAVVQALGVRQLRIGTAIVPGVPWTQAADAEGRPLLLALKSGNFGQADFFTRALAQAA